MSGHTKSLLLDAVDLIKGKNKNQRNFRIYGKWIRRFGVVSVVGLVTLMAFIAVPVARESDQADAVIPDAAVSVLAMTTGRPSADVDLVVTNSDGTFVASDNEHSAHFGAYTTNYTGYTLTVASTDDSRQLKNTIGSNVVGVLDSISSPTSAETFQNGSASTYKGKWGWKPSVINSTPNTSFLQAPTTTIQTMNETSCANGTPSCPSQIDNYSIEIAARADYTKAYGTYTNTFVLNMVANPISYTIQFKDDYGSGVPATIYGSTSTATNVQLPDTIPSRTNYTFRAWCDGEVTANGTACSGKEYEAGSDYPISQTESGNVTLTAVYYISMQDLSFTNCPEEPALAVDYRDGQKYYVRKMADGRCWMLDNLNLGATDISVTLDRSNSNFSSKTVTAATFNSWRKTEATAGTYDDGVMFHVDGTDPTSKNAYGMLYNYYAATGGNTEGATNITIANYDICPKGWRMPTSTANGEYTALATSFGSTAALQYAGMRAPVSEGGAAFSLAGAAAVDALPTAAGSTNTDYWSSTDGTGNYTAAYRLAMRLTTTTTTAPTTGTNLARNRANPVRCVLRPTIENITYLDQFDILATPANIAPSEDRKSVLASMEENKEYVLRDRRDEQEYTIAKLKDGRVWMTQNLNLGATPITVAIGTANTNASTAITVANYNSYKKTAFTSTRTASEYVPVEGYDTTAKAPYGTLYNYMITSDTLIKTDLQQADATYDICPAGWRLPTGESFGEFTTLYNAYGNGANMRKSVAEGGAGFALAGTAIGTGQGSTGNYWTSMRSTNIGMLAMGFNGNTVTLNKTFNRGAGASIRCILKSNINDIDTMQEFKNMKTKQRADIVAYMTDSRINYTLKDDRDNTYYTVAKYADGTVWMSQDLKLTSLSGLNANNTNVTTSRTPSVSVYDSTATGSYSSYTTGYIIRPTGAKDATSRSDYGALYNYYAASAGTVSGSSNSTETLEDICPAGWRLPVGGATGEFKTLSANTNYNSLAKLKNPIYVLGAALSMTGDYSSGIQNQGTSVFYWSSSANDATTRFGYDSTLTLANAVAGTAARNTLHPIRCTLKFTADTMQDFNSATFTANQKTGIAYSMYPQMNYSLLDNRDHRYYTVAKLKDGRVWMTQNLSLGATVIDTDLTSVTTNLSTARTAAVFNAWKVTSGSTSLTAGEFIVTSNGGDVLYNFAAASALSIAAASSTGNASYDLCPAGWKLPTGNTTGEQGLLYNQYNSATLMTNSIANGGAAYTLPGYTAGTSVTNAGTAGRYWSATVNTATGRYIIDLSSTSVSLTTVGTRSYHYSIRCILK